MTYALFWSGGKDSLLALDRSRRTGLDVTHLVNIYEGNTGRVRFHGVRKELLEAQARALGLELISEATHPRNFEAAFQSALQELKRQDIKGICFGNIHLSDIREWYESRTTSNGFQHVEPLWGSPPEALISEFIGRGHRARVVSVFLKHGKREWLGHEFTEKFAAELSAEPEVDICGERGEYHSFAFGGPLFREELLLCSHATFEREGHLILDLELG
jgi:diphthine-ammonia ligase